MRAGDIAFVYFPFSYLEEEPYKRRPVLVVGGTPEGEVGDHALLVTQVTGSMMRVSNPRRGDILVTRWKEAGLRVPSVVRSWRLWTPEPRDFVAGPPVGRVDDDLLSEVLQHVRLLISSQGS